MSYELGFVISDPKNPRVPNFKSIELKENAGFKGSFIQILNYIF